MKTSSFIYGAIVGAAVYRMMPKRRGMSLVSMVRNADLGQLANTAMQNFTGASNQGGSRRNGGNSGSGTRSANNQTGVQKTTSDSKAANLKQLKDFIRSNPEVKSEVEQILKETHTVIPGL